MTTGSEDVQALPRQKEGIMSSGGVCHYCHKRDCECPDSLSAQLRELERQEMESNPEPKPQPE